jgi:hypothetical protein
MKEMLEKLSSYNLFNYLLPGTLFAACAERMSVLRFVGDDVVFRLVMYYVVGLAISRIGSLVLEPSMKWVSFVKFAPYEDFVSAGGRDPKLELLSETNNTYRSLCATFLALAAFKGYDLLVAYFAVPALVTQTTACVGLFILFAFAYRKQTTYITKRVAHAQAGGSK